MAVYNLKVTKRQALPRSKRLRELGGGGDSSTSSVVTINSGGNVTPGAAHYHANKAALDQITTDADGYQYLTHLVEQPDGTLAEVTEKVKAGYADCAGDLSEEAIKKLPYLSKLSDDVANGNITFEKMISVLGLSVFKSGAQFGEFINSLAAGSGAGIDEQGNATFESVRVRSYFECLELIINRLSTIEGDQILTEGDTIESVEHLGGYQYGLYLKPKWEGYTTSQVVNNVLKGIVNTLSEGHGTYYTCWLRIDRVRRADNYIEVTMYHDGDTPSGKNYPPEPMMKIARWGNQTNTNYQSCIYLSSSEGRIVRLTGVTQPILTPSNYGSTFGTLPEFLTSLDLPVVNTQDYVYARGLIVQDIIRLNYLGKPEATIVDRGRWASGEAYYCNSLNPSTQIYETSDVWHYGCRYRCAKTGTTAEPQWGGTDWAFVEGNPELMVDIAEETVFCNLTDNFSAKLSIRVFAYNRDITDTILDTAVRWSRYSEDANGIPRLALDRNWAYKRSSAGKVLTLSLDDFDLDGTIPKVMRFTASIDDATELPD